MQPAAVWKELLESQLGHCIDLDRYSNQAAPWVLVGSKAHAYSLYTSEHLRSGTAVHDKMDSVTFLIGQ